MKILEWINKIVPPFKRGAWADKASLRDEYVIRECEFCDHSKVAQDLYHGKDSTFCENKDADRHGMPAYDGCINFKEENE